MQSYMHVAAYVSGVCVPFNRKKQQTLEINRKEQQTLEIPNVKMGSFRESYVLVPCFPENRFEH